jgi:chromosomal replication initiator protein
VWPERAAHPVSLGQQFEQYREADVLLIDDAEMLARCDSARGRIADIARALGAQGKRVILALADEPDYCRAMARCVMPDLAGCQVVDLQPPGPELRYAILTRRAQAESVDLPARVCRYVASCTGPNLRVTQGAFVRMVAYSKVTKLPVSLLTAREALKGFAD